MLPPELSADACSLAPGVERLAVTVEIVLAADGAPRSTSFYRSRIRSDERLSYEELDEFFAGPDRSARADRAARSGSPAGRPRRSPRAGAAAALEISTTEPEFEFDAEGNVDAPGAVEQTEAHSLIEQLMICANERVAEQLERRGTPTLYRVHERPDGPRVAALIEKLAALDLPTPPVPEDDHAERRGGAGRRGEPARQPRGGASRARPRRRIHHSCSARSNPPSTPTENLGHAGLGSPAYCHFTSPIRRYPDLIAHRALLSGLGAGEDEPERGEVREAGVWCSEREREAMTIERDADDVCAAFLLERELFEAGPEATLRGRGLGADRRRRVRRASAARSATSTRASCRRGGWAGASATTSTRPRQRSSAAAAGGACGSATRSTVRVDGVEAPRGRVDLVPVPEAES